MLSDWQQIREERDYLERTIATVRNHAGADNCWPQWANIFADEIERMWGLADRLVAERDEALKRADDLYDTIHSVQVGELVDDALGYVETRAELLDPHDPLAILAATVTEMRQAVYDYEQDALAAAAGRTPGAPEAFIGKAGIPTVMEVAPADAGAGEAEA